jgi:hypothetical protein
VLLITQHALHLSVCMFKLKRPPLPTPVLMCVLFPILNTSLKIEHSAWNVVCLSLYRYTVDYFEHHIQNLLLPFGMLNKDHANLARPVSLSLFMFEN